jgi:glycosyltransferase involved in cell wall biosynthesis
MNNAIKISIIIATRNRGEILLQTLQKAVEAIADNAVEIIVVNDGEAEIVLPINITNKIVLFKNPSTGVSAARNFGVTKSKGEILFFVDDDMWINKEAINWIQNFVIQNNNTQSVYNLNWQYPPYLNEKLQQSKVGRFILKTNYHKFWGRMGNQTTAPTSGLFKYCRIGSCSLVMSKTIFQKIGGYEESIKFAGEDENLENKIKNLSIKIYVVFDVILFHNHQDRLEINGFLHRINTGYESEFNANKLGTASQLTALQYSTKQKLAFNFFLVTEKIWISVHKLLPNVPILQPLQNKLIGGLGGLQKFKHWQNSR